MKRTILATLSVLSMSALMATTAVAESGVVRHGRENRSAMTSSHQMNPLKMFELSPANLVNLAYQGHFRSQGIPGYGGLLDAYASKQLSAQNLVQVAIATGKLPATSLSNSAYLQAVEANLISLRSI